MYELWHVYFGDVCFISAAAVEEFLHMHVVLESVEDVTSISWIFVLFACFIALIEVGRYINRVLYSYI